VTGCCECGKVFPDSINCGEFLDKLRNCQLLKKDSILQSHILNNTKIHDEPINARS